MGKTAILYGANLNSKRVNKYLNLLLEKGFIEETEESSRKYKVTEKGKKFVVHYRELKREFDS